MPALMIAWMQNLIAVFSEKVQISHFLKIGRFHKAGLPKNNPGMTRILRKKRRRREIFS